MKKPKASNYAYLLSIGDIDGALNAAVCAYNRHRPVSPFDIRILKRSA